MTDQELHDLIAANAEAKAMADAGNDAGCTAMIAGTLPATIESKYIDYSSILAAFADPVDGMTAIGGLQAAGEGNPAVKLMLGWLESTCSTGLNIGSPGVRGMLDLLVAGGAITSQAASTIKAIAEAPAVITADQVSAAWLQYRPDGRIA